MKLILVLLFVALSCAHDIKITEEQKAKAIENAEACMKQEGVTKEQTMVLKEGKFENLDPKVKCFINCFFEQGGYLADGQVKSDVVLSKLSPIFGEDKVKSVQAKCDALKGSDKCDTAFVLYKCYYENKAMA